MKVAPTPRKHPIGSPLPRYTRCRRCGNFLPRLHVCPLPADDPRHRGICPPKPTEETTRAIFDLCLRFAVFRGEDIEDDYERTGYTDTAMSVDVRSALLVLVRNYPSVSHDAIMLARNLLEEQFERAHNSQRQMRIAYIRHMLAHGYDVSDDELAKIDAILTDDERAEFAKLRTNPRCDCSKCRRKHRRKDG
jgi:hypothetical protein